MLRGVGLRISCLNSGLNITKNLKYDYLPISSEPVRMRVQAHTHTKKHRHKSLMAIQHFLSTSPLLASPFSYNFTPINLTHLITGPAPRPQGSHILHTPLPPFWVQPQLWNPTTNNSLAWFLPLDLLTVPPATNNGTSRIQKSSILFETQKDRDELSLLFISAVVFLFCLFLLYCMRT